MLNSIKDKNGAFKADNMGNFPNYVKFCFDKKGNHHNEIVGYTPKINAVIAKVPKFKDVSEELLKFAYENKLPIILM